MYLPKFVVVVVVLAIPSIPLPILSAQTFRLFHRRALDLAEKRIALRAIDLLKQNVSKVFCWIQIFHLDCHGFYVNRNKIVTPSKKAEYRHKF